MGWGEAEDFLYEYKCCGGYFTFPSFPLVCFKGGTSNRSSSYDFEILILSAIRVYKLQIEAPVATKILENQLQRIIVEGGIRPV